MFAAPFIELQATTRRQRIAAEGDGLGRLS